MEYNPSVKLAFSQLTITTQPSPSFPTSIAATTHLEWCWVDV